MFIVHTVSELQQLVTLARQQKKTIGFVPTMGALHFGHLALVRACKARCGVTVVSIFVNPTQFNNPDDLQHYPRTLKSDAELLHALNTDIVFAPSEKEIYPTPDTRKFDFGAFEQVMEGQFRPGHFNGVAQVVSRLFEIVEPDFAFFGEKDFQQLTIVRILAAETEPRPFIVACPTVREPDGLAMSSRNMLLTEEQRNAAPLIYQTLLGAKEKMATTTVDEVKKWVIKTINANKILEVEYAEIVNELTLQPIHSWDDAERVRLCVAIYARPVRLIDNIQLK